MEVKINKEIRNYTESVFFGLSLRQLVFSACAVLTSAAIYLLLKPHLGSEVTSWLCILGATPFAALAFIKYNGMTAEKILAAWIKSEILTPAKLELRSVVEQRKKGKEAKKCSKH